MDVRREVVGREQELAVIARFLEAGPRPGVLLLQGEAGIGKTTLWDAGVDAARTAGTRVLAARPAEAEAGLAFAALTDLLADVLDEVAPALPPPRLHALRVALLLAEAEDEVAEARAVAAGALSALETLARAGPLVVAIDDVQWLDAASGRALTFALRRLHGAPVAVLLAQRIDGDAALPLELGRAPLTVERLTVGPLAATVLQRLVAHRLDDAVPRAMVRRVHEASGGNPFFALELARSVAVEGGDPLRLPSGLRGLAQRRFAALSPAARELLPLVAALPQATAGKLRLVHGAASDPALEDALRAGVLRLDGQRIRFAHPLLASAAYAELSGPQRRALHAALAAASDEPVERGHHLALAAEGPDASVAAELDAAVPHARARGASHEAAELAAHARRLTLPGDDTSARRRAAVEADCLRLVGETARARAVLDDALAGCPPGVERARLLFGRGQVEAWGVDWGGARDALRAARGELGDGDPRLLAEIELRLAQFFSIVDDDPAPLAEQAAAAARAAERVGDTLMLGEALAQLGRARIALGRDDDGLLERALALEPSIDVPSAINRPSDYVAEVWWWHDDPQRTLTTLRAIAQASEDRGEETGLSWTLARIAVVSCVTGSFEVAEAAAARARDLIAELDQPENDAVMLAACAFVAAHRGDEAAAEEAASAAAARRVTPGPGRIDRLVRMGLGRLALSRGEPKDAAAHLGPLVDRAREIGIGEPGALPFVPDAVEALLGAADVPGAERLLGWYAGLAEEHGRRSALAAAARCRGLIESATGDAAAATATLERALALAADVPYPLERARTLLALGATQRRARQRRAARETLGAAHDAFEDLGARLWAERAAAELGRIAGRAPGSDVLTPTERRVAELAAGGLANREIAAALFVSTKTVEFHLRNVFRKLGVTARAQLARRL